MTADPHHRLEVEMPPQPVRVRADPRRLQLVISSLLATSLKLARAGGEVNVRVHENEHRVTVELRDAGPGLSPDEMARLFERFERATSGGRIAGGGAGLGLYLARGLARLHGGDITVSSHGARGSTFTLSLPRARPASRGPSS
jgi:two-component system sensor histidine kinase BaeS